MKPNQNSTTPIVQLTSYKQSTWRQQAKRLHDDGHEDFRMVCATARACAQHLAFPRDNSFFALINNMKFIEKSFFELEHATGQIEEIYNKAYSISAKVDPSQLADVIQFPGERRVAK
ncbi:hypothetical protein [uncultured Desulfobacter sp.]|uniref:hypothetical protein n=1 Tax=uncultured Desulfobacter sp. TaxID=240139 RepID=UPI002AAAE37A|nr:hypothetical protein [uncultured Desulfobacter sp.]